MENKKRISVQKGGSLNEEERLTICRLLIKAGYTVRLYRERTEGKSTATVYIEYWRD